MILEAKTCSVHFKGLQAVKDFSLRLNEGGIYGLIGTNGAGKTTVINMLSGQIRPSAGVVTFKGKNITHEPPDRIAHAGIARTYQNLRLFNKMTVLENVIVGVIIKKQYGVLDGIFQTKRWREAEASIHRKAMRMLDFMGIAAYADATAGALPYGLQRKLEIARILAVDPALVLLDEPAAGMNPQESMELVDMLRRVREAFRLTILLIEHDMKVVMNLCEYIYVMASGETIAEGKPDQIRDNPDVIRAYLGRAS
jgi:branched-chain amino acid transport system ATP-binding protein